MATQTATKPSLTLKRRLKAPPAKVFAAWTDPEKVKGWMGPGEGKVHDVRGVYREFVPNQKLVFTWAWKSTPERESLVTVEIKPDGDGSLLTLTHEQFFDEEARDRHQGGWTRALDKFEKFVA